MRSKALLMSGVAVLAAGCTPVDPGFSEAVRYDMAIQTVDPDPQYPADAAQPGDSGEKAQKASERYRKGQTKALKQQGAGGGSGGGGGTGGSGGGNTPGS